MKENTKRYQCPNCGWTASEEIEKEHLEHCRNRKRTSGTLSQLPVQYPSGQGAW